MYCKKTGMITFMLIAFTCKAVSGEGVEIKAVQSVSEEIKPPSDIVTISYPQGSDTYYLSWEQYFIELLTLAMSKVDEPHKLVAIPTETHTEGRAVQLLEQDVVSVHWLHTSTQSEQLMLPIRVPLFKGLIGWRLFFIHQSKTNQFKQVQTLEQLKEFSALQGLSWPDTPILQNNGLKVVTSRNVSTLFRMLQHGRGDYFPRSVIEIWRELNDYPVENLVIEKNLIVRYPTAYYFFVKKNNFRARDLIKKGLMIAVSDGSFDELFMKYFGAIIQQSNLQNRKIFTLKYNNIPPQTPLSHPELWFSIR